MSPDEALAFVERHGIVLQSAKGPVPNLAEAIAGHPIRGSWWGHPKGRDIYQASVCLGASADVLVCRIVEDKVTYVHRRLWPALVKLAGRFEKERLAKVTDEHTPGGRHRTVREPFPDWVPGEVAKEARKLSEREAEVTLRAALPFARKTKA